jgi:integrase
LGSVTRHDIDRFIDILSERKLSAGRRNTILKAGTIPLRWAFSKEIIDKDIVAGITWFSGEPGERQILTPEVAGAVFRVGWKDERARLANMLAAVTGLRSGEIRGLRVQDLGEDCLYIRHSWNCRDRLKTTKNNVCRVVEVPFPGVIQDILFLAKSNPHGAAMDSYAFWARDSSSKPADGTLFVEGLRDALEKTGMSHEAAMVYVFHGWRHFYTSYMREQLDTKLLQSQTGHKTLSMLEHYSRHRLTGDREKIRNAGIEAFGSLVPQGQLKDLS